MSNFFYETIPRKILNRIFLGKTLIKEKKHNRSFSRKDLMKTSVGKSYFFIKMLIKQKIIFSRKKLIK